MYSSSNEPGGTSYRSRLENKKFTFAGKTGSSQIKKFTEEQREAEVKQEDLDYKSRDHALFIAFAPVSDPKYAISVLLNMEDQAVNLPPLLQKKLLCVIERHELRQSINILQSSIMYQSRSIQFVKFKDKIFSIDYFSFININSWIISMFAMYSTDGGEFKYHTKSHILIFFFFIMFFSFFYSNSFLALN